MLSVTDQNDNAITSSTHIGNLNPFRYRGYYLDTETGFYYLMSRYYDPVTHRFINADGYFQSGGDILDFNMSAYCRNNPINFYDPLGSDCICLHQRVRGNHVCNKSTTNSSNTKIVSADYQVGTVQQNSSGYPLGWYTKVGEYYIDNYQPSYVSSYSFYNCDDLVQSEAGVNILGISLFAGFDNLGLQLGMPIGNDTYSIEATISLNDCCVRIGWDSTQYGGNDTFLVSGGGLEANFGTLATIGAAIYSYVNGYPIKFDAFQGFSTNYQYAYQ